jgi:hypothetical protein
MRFAAPVCLIAEQTVKLVCLSRKARKQPPAEIPAAPPRIRLRWMRPAIIALAAFCLLGLFATEAGDTDFWWHLKTGEYIVQRHSLPAPDPFSYTADLGAPQYPAEEKVRYFNLTHEWLAQVLWYLLYRAAGFPGIVLFKALLLAGFCGIAGLIAARRSNSFYWGLASAGGAATVAVMFSADRPALLSFFLAAVFLWILERGRPLWLLPVLSLLWANSHGGYFLGWVVLGAYSVAALVDHWRGRPGAGGRRLWIVSLVSIAVSALNPSHFRIIPILFAYRQSHLMQSLVEWARPPLWGPPYCFPVLLYAAAIVMLIGWRKVRKADWLLFIPFAAASLMAFRNVMLIGFLAPILIASYFPWRRKLPAPAAPAVMAVLLIALLAGIARGRFFQLRAAEWKFPSGAADWILAHRIQARMFNTYEYGGYLMWRLWPAQRVFIDGRALNESVYNDYAAMLGNVSRETRQGLLDRYGIGMIVANAFEYTSGVLYPMIPALAGQAETEWQLVYQDPQALVFLRRPPAGMPVLNKSEIRDHLESECRVHLEKDPELNLCARTLGFFFQSAGDVPRARSWFSAYLGGNHDPDPEAEAVYRRLLRR